MPQRPLFSVLIPSKNRLKLLNLAIESVLRQKFADVEIVIADNASSPTYESYIQLLASAKVRYVRSDEPLSVTENWNRAVEASTGRYVIMLGDDDALTPGALDRLSAVIAEFEEPDVVYAMAYHYAYPGVFPHAPAGYLLAVNNSSLFGSLGKAYELNGEEGRRLGEDALKFRHNVSFNAQHFVWRRTYIEARSKLSPFFQSPYPDYFACFVTFLTAPRIAVVPAPQIVIGIAKQSFGFYYVNSNQKEGFSQFQGSERPRCLTRFDNEVEGALTIDGSGHYRNWLIAAATAQHAVSGSVKTTLDLSRYRKIQSLELLARRGFPLAGIIERAVYHPMTVIPCAIGPHLNILDAYRWLEKNNPCR